MLVLICFLALKVYTVVGAGWSRNSKYSLLGGLRAAAQAVSYEVSLVVLLLIPFILGETTRFNLLSGFRRVIWLGLIPVILLWGFTIVAETNRQPFDFAEGERELVSGFNTEYSSLPFTLLFLREYGSIVFFSSIRAVMFFSFFKLRRFMLVVPLISGLVQVVFVWLRGSLPRFRYDFLMNFS